MHGSSVDWMLGWWGQRHHDNILFVRYEDMLQDIPREIQRVADFLQVDMSDRLLERILKDSSFKEMQANPNINRDNNPNFDQTKYKFVRSGKKDEWKTHFTVSQNEWFDAKYEKALTERGLKFI